MLVLTVFVFPKITNTSKMGGWGVLDDPKYPNIPGTINLNEEIDAAKLEDWEYEEPKKIGDIGRRNST